MSEVFHLERQLEEYKKVVERRDLAKKLYNNREFKKVILDDFCGRWVDRDHVIPPSSSRRGAWH